MGNSGDEQTAFRFTLDGAGNVTGHNQLPVKLVGGGVAAGVSIR